MALIFQKLGVAKLGVLTIALVFTAGFALAEDGKPLSAEEIETLINGATRSGKYTGGTYYITFQKDGNYCARANSKDGDCLEMGPWWFEGNTVCRKSARSGEYCWNVTKLSENQFRSEITRVKSSNLNVGRKREFWIE